MYCFAFQGYEKEGSSIFLTNPRITASKQCMCGHKCEKPSAGVPPFLTVLLVGGTSPNPLGHDKHAAAHSKNASYPGNFRIPLEDAKSGGFSDPRNTALMKMFNLINVGERAGSGIPSIFRIWEKQKWITPTLTEELSPERITLYLPIGGDKKSAIKTSDKKPAIKSNSKISSHHKEVIIEYLTAHVSASAAEIGTILELKSSRVRELLSDLLKQGYIVSEGSNRNRIYKLKA